MQCLRADCHAGCWLARGNCGDGFRLVFAVRTSLKLSVENYGGSKICSLFVRCIWGVGSMVLNRKGGQRVCCLTSIDLKYMEVDLNLDMNLEEG